MSAYWDLAVYDRSGQLALVVEVKSILHATAEWASSFRRNLLSHGNIPHVPYFLMAFPDRFFLWKIDVSNPGVDVPALVVEAQPILQPYLDESGVTADQISGQGLELIVSSWLIQLMMMKPEELDDQQRWVLDSGLFQAVKGGKLDREVLV